jgi:hypothetical protein
VQQCSALCNNAEPCNIPSPANGFDLTADWGSVLVLARISAMAEVFSVWRKTDASGSGFVSDNFSGVDDSVSALKEKLIDEKNWRKAFVLVHWALEWSDDSRHLVVVRICLVSINYIALV